MALDTVQKSFTGCACQLSAGIVLTNGVGDVRGWIFYMRGRVDELRASWVGAVDTIPTPISLETRSWKGQYILGEDRVLANLLCLKRPLYIEGDIGFIQVEQEDLAATLGRIQALGLRGALEEGGHIIRAYPVSLTRSFEKLLAASLFAATNDASFRHTGVRVRKEVGDQVGVYRDIRSRPVLYDS